MLHSSSMSRFVPSLALVPTPKDDFASAPDSELPVPQRVSKPADMGVSLVFCPTGGETLLERWAVYQGDSLTLLLCPTGRISADQVRPARTRAALCRASAVVLTFAATLPGTT